MKNPIRSLYNWVLSWAETPFGGWALFGLAFVESSFFPIPPDVLLIALVISIPAKAFRYALVCSVGSVLGGCFGYFIGLQFHDTIGRYIIDQYQIKISDLNTFVAIFVAGFTPIPYKVFTIAAGFFKVNLLIFILASGISRSARFFLVATLLYLIGPKTKTFIDRDFNRLTILFVLLLILGFLVLRWIG